MFKRREPKPDLEKLLDLIQLIQKSLLDYIEKPSISSDKNDAELLFHIHHKAEQIQFTVTAALYLMERQK